VKGGLRHCHLDHHEQKDEYSNHGVTPWVVYSENLFEIPQAWITRNALGC
jgi:hypothetical protein